MYFAFRKMIAFALLLISVWNIELSMAEDLTTIADSKQSHVFVDIDQHPCHSEDATGSEHRHICHLGHCAVTSLGSTAFTFLISEFRNNYQTIYISFLKPSPALVSLLRPPIVA
jgi:hypothetical protein